MAVQVIEGDITKVRADVVVNAANTQLIHGGGVARAIAQAAGPELEAASREAGFVPLGSFAVTPAGNLPAKVVVHIPTIDYTTNQRISLDALRSVWRSVLSWARKEGHRSLAVPLLGAGVVGLPEAEVEQLLAEEATRFPSLSVTIVRKR